MEPKMITKSGFKVVGLEYYGENKNQEIRSLWDKFCVDYLEIPGVTKKDLCYGVCFMEEGDINPNAFHYLCAVENKSLDPIPKGMRVIDIPEQKYASFTHKGNLGSLKETYDYIYGKWLPGSGHRKTGGYDLEVYDERFKDDSDDSEFDILIALQD